MSFSTRQLLTALLLCLGGVFAQAQTTIKGIVLDAANNDPIIGANIIIEGTAEGTTSDWDGTFEFSTDKSLPINLEVTYIGYSDKIITVDENKRLNITMEESVQVVTEAIVKASRISDKQKESPLTVEALDIIAIKETPAANFYDGLGALKGVDLTAASLGFKVINTRGFNSTSPVRSLQTIDGIDNQAPGLNFSLGNFLGSSELDINKVELIVGASSAFYGPNAFNGVISMETKDPFFHNGLSGMVKVGERNMLNGALRWADVFQNSKGDDLIAYKLNFEYLRADDWVADNYDPVDGSEFGIDNPGGVDAVNIYGDEYYNGNDLTEFQLSDPISLLGEFHRTGYREIDLVDYNTRNYKANVAVHLRTNPDQKEQSPEVIFSTNFGSGTTVYQGDNRFSLKGITFLQNRLEYRKKNKFFLRAYTTRTGAGDSYDPYFTALQLQESAKDDREWSVDYNTYWTANVNDRINESDYPKLTIVTDENGNPIFDPVTFEVLTEFDAAAAEQWQIDNRDLLTQWHAEAANFANQNVAAGSIFQPFFEPGTDRFQQEFDRITGTLISDGGTKFFDNSALYHVHGEYTFNPLWIDEIRVGANYRLYTPVTQGTIFSDTAGIKITNSEVGFYGGGTKSLASNKVKVSATIRADKNQNFDWLLSPAASVVYTPSQNNFFRVSFSSAIRNPTLSDQYLSFNIGPATLSGNLNGVEDLVTIESLFDFFDSQQASMLDTFAIAPVRPEAVKTGEFGFRTTLFDKMYVDAGYYFSIYDNFIGYQIGADLEYSTDGGGVTVNQLDIFRYSSNSQNQVTTQGFTVGVNYYLGQNYTLIGNYSWNRLNTQLDDPIIPAFNTPEHKFNFGFGGRNLTINMGERKLRNLSFNINYKWIEGFLFEGSPQFTGFIPTYDMLDAQVSFGLPKINSILKIGASNILNSLNFQTYGGPRIGRLAYVTFLYEGK